MKQDMKIILLLLAIFAMIYVGNYVWPCIGTQQSGWQFVKHFPVISAPAGRDFMYVYNKVHLLIDKGVSPYKVDVDWYPPFVYLFYMPTYAFSYLTAYKLHIVINTLALLLNIGILMAFAWRGLQQSGHRLLKVSTTLDWQALSIGLLISMQVLASYAFMFGVERGNNDALVMLFVLSAVWLLAFHPQRFWLPIVLITLAAQLKVYPLLFFVMVLWRFRWRAVLPIVLLNVLLTFSLGLQAAYVYTFNLTHFVEKPHMSFTGFLNHSGPSFMIRLADSLKLPAAPANLFGILLPFSIWAVSMHALRKLEKTPLQFLWMFMATLSTAMLMPTISNDYKLTLLSPLIGVLLLFMVVDFLDGKRFWWLQLAILSIIMCGITRSSGITYFTQGDLLANRFPYVFILQLFVYLQIIKLQKQLTPIDSSTAASTI